jgi:hypothetical protein
MQYDFIAIGDITTDAFIRLKDVRVHCDINDVQCELCVRFGDKVPYESGTARTPPSQHIAWVSRARSPPTSATIRTGLTAWTRFGKKA